MPGNSSLRILFFYNSIFVLAVNLFGPLYAIYINRYSHPLISVSFSWSLLLISNTFFSIILAHFGDRFKEKEYLLMAGWLIRSVVWFSYIFVGSFSQILFLQVVTALGESLSGPAFDSIFAKHLDSDKSVKTFSQWRIVNNLTIALATIIGGYIVTYFGFSILFAIMFSLSLIAFIGLFIQPRQLL